MAYFEQVVDYEKFTFDEADELMKSNGLSRENCMKKFTEISNLF